LNEIFTIKRIDPFRHSHSEKVKRNILRVVTDFPDPDSPTIANVFHLFKLKTDTRIAFTYQQ